MKTLTLCYSFLYLFKNAVNFTVVNAEALMITSITLNFRFRVRN